MKRLGLALAAIAALVAAFFSRNGGKHRGAVLEAQTDAIEARKETVDVKAELDKERIHNARNKAVDQINRKTELLVSDILGSDSDSIQRRIDEYARKYGESRPVAGSKDS